MAEVTAKLNNLRLAPRKVRAVSNLIKGKNALNALSQLEVMIKRPGLPVTKLLKSALSNAENNHNMVKENMYIKSIKVDEGVKLKRFRPKGFGRVSPIEKKTSHISVILAEKVPGLKRQAEKVEKKTAGYTEKSNLENAAKNKRPEIKTELGKREGIFKGLGRRMFRRKSI